MNELSKAEKNKLILQNTIKKNIKGRCTIKDVLKVLEAYFPPYKLGIQETEYKVHCPFHPNPVPTFTFDRNHYHCSACNCQGDVIELYRALRHHQVDMVTPSDFLHLLQHMEAVLENYQIGDLF